MSNAVEAKNDFEDEELRDVNVTPLADVSLTLLIVMMMLAPLAMQAMITVNAGKARSAPRRAAEILSGKPIFIDIGEEMIFLNNEMIEEGDVFPAKFKSLLEKNTEPHVIITVSPGVKHGRVVQVLDEAKVNGAKNLSIVPRKKI
jgi:biopolymer transport protein ExbD